VVNNPKFLESYRAGAHPLLTESKHQFRDREKEKELIGKDFLNYTYRSSADRAHEESDAFHKMHLNQEPFSIKVPNKRTDWLRSRDELKEIHQPMRFYSSNEIDRIKDVLDKREPLERTNFDLSTYYNPVWRDVSPDKWANPHTQFIPIKGNKDKTWDITKNTDSQYKDPYFDGLSSVGDQGIARVRQKLREISPVEFSSTIKQDPWGDSINITRSVRSYKSIGATLAASGMRDFANTTQGSRFTRTKDYHTSNSSRKAPFSKRISVSVPRYDNDCAFEVQHLLDNSKANLIYAVDNKFRASKNSKYQIKEDINDGYILSQLDGQKTYYKSLQESIKEPTPGTRSIQTPTSAYSKSEKKTFWVQSKYCFNSAALTNYDEG